MGCFVSKHQEEVQETASKFIPSEIKSQIITEGDKHSITEAADSIVSTFPIPDPDLTSIRDSESSGYGSSVVRPSHEPYIPWNLDYEEINSKRTYSVIESIKATACAELGIPKGRIALIDTVKGWFVTNTGAFSPGNYMEGSVPQTQVNKFRLDGGNPVLTIPDMTKVPEYADRPAVKHRPHMTFRSGMLLISRLSRHHSHPIGYIFLWDSVPHPLFTKEQDTRVAELAGEAVEALQRSLLDGLGVHHTVSEIAQSGIDIQLPTLWIDIHTPMWSMHGMNREWETLTGVSLHVLHRYSGLLGLMGPSDGSSTLDLKEAVLKAVSEIKPEDTIPVILSPRDPSGACLQYALALRRAVCPPPISMNRGTAPHPTTDYSKLWMIEVHVRVNVDTHRGRRSLQLSDDQTPVRMSAQSYHSGGGRFSKCSIQSGDIIPEYGTVPFMGEAERLSTSSYDTRTMTTTGTTASQSNLESSGDMHECNHPTAIPASERASNVPPRLTNLEFGYLMGSGSYADVYAGHLGGRAVAIKVIDIPGTNEKKKNWGAHYEALLAGDVRHPNLVETYDWCRVQQPQGWQVWIVQELCSGGNLSSAIAHRLLRIDHSRRKGPNMGAILATAIEVARGMAYLHSQDILHGDLSTNNILLDTKKVVVSPEDSRGFVAKVTDFGMSRNASETRNTETVGTVSAMPPELLLDGTLSKAVDVYSFGICLWEMYTGERAWADMSHAQIIFAVSCQNKRLRSLKGEGQNEGVTAAFADLVDRCTAINPAERPTFNEIILELDTLSSAR